MSIVLYNMRPLQEQRVLVLHPFLNYYGGAEYLLSVVVNEIVPQADLYTFSYKDSILEQAGIDKKRIISPFGSGIASAFYAQSTPLYPSLIDTFSTEGYDVVLSFSYCYVHGVVTGHQQPHISYIQTPMRLLWLHESEYYWYDKVPGIREFYRTILAWQRVWDRQAAMRPDYLLSNAKSVKQRVQAFWNRESEVIYPPVDTTFYTPSEAIKKEEYFITHSRLVRYKRIELLIEACKAKKRKLLVVGDGPDYRRLKSAAGNSSDITFTGYVSHEEKKGLLQRAQGFLFAAEEDFGIAPVEAMAAGTPILAFGKGGVTETVTLDTGMFYKEQTVESVTQMIDKFENFSTKIPTKVLLAQAEKFSKERFIKEYKKFIEKKIKEFTEQNPPLFV